MPFVVLTETGLSEVFAHLAFVADRGATDRVLMEFRSGSRGGKIVSPSNTSPVLAGSVAQVYQHPSAVVS